MALRSRDERKQPWFFVDILSTTMFMAICIVCLLGVWSDEKQFGLIVTWIQIQVSYYLFAFRQDT